VRRILPILGYLGLITASALGATILASVVTPRSWPAAYAWLVKATLVMSCVIAVTAAYLRHASLAWSDFGVRAEMLASPVGIGSVMGLSLGMAWVGVVYWIAPFELHWNPHVVPTRWLAASLGTVAIGIGEEVGYRSFALRELRVRTGYWPAAFITTALFAASHYAGGVPWQATLLVVGSAGALFSVVMLETSSLPFVIAMHATTNLVQDNLLRPAIDSSLFMLAAGRGPGPGDLIDIWLAMMAVNVLALGAVLAIRKRTRAGPTT
jgi:membrane protease YdiL (CAAX protease family)